MKDRVARQLIVKLWKQVEQLERKISMIEHPHPKDCNCNICSGFEPDYLSVLSIEEQLAFTEASK